MSSESKTLFIGTQYLRDNTIINDNVDAKVLQPIIRSAQTKYIQQTIGTSLYDKMIELVDDANPSNPIPVPITGVYKTLLEDYIIPVLMQYSIYEAIPFMNFKFRNKSISKQSSDNSTPADLSELSYIRDNVLQTAQFYSERMSKYLCNNGTLFPEYTSNDDLNPNTQNYFSGIFIPKRRCNWINGYDGYYGNNNLY